jgi:serine protease Do
MDFEKKNTPKNCEYEPCDPGVYRTGSTEPQKSHRGIIAVLLVAVIILCGVVTILGVMNIHLFRQLKNDSDAHPFRFSYTTPESIAVSATGAGDATLDISETMGMTSIHIGTTPAITDNSPLNGGFSLQEIYERTIHSVVSISCALPGGTSTGTGVILSADGYIVTNCHVVENAEQIQVLLHDGRTVQALLIGTDTLSDLAVLQISVSGLTPATLGDSSALRVGDTVVAIGDPLGIELRGTMTNGIISAINRDVDVGGRSMSLIQTNAALNTGNSGGPLINCYGQVIGINTLKIGDTVSIAGVEGLGFAIPSTTVKEIVEQLISQGYVSGRPELGIEGEIITPFYQLYYNLPQGLYITEVLPESSAETAGLEPGDILISLDGTKITSINIFQSLIYSYTPGDTVEAVVFRNQHHYRVTLIVGEATK